MTSPEITWYCGCPASTFAKVDLPEPFGPMMAWTSPLLTFRLMPFKISLPSTEAVRLRISNIHNSKKMVFGFGSLALEPPSNPRQRPKTKDLSSPNGAFQLQSEQPRRFNRKLHRQLQKNVFAKTVNDERHGVLL